jgi:hypothetical protein
MRGQSVSAAPRGRIALTDNEVDDFEHGGEACCRQLGFGWNLDLLEQSRSAYFEWIESLDP